MIKSIVSLHNKILHFKGPLFGNGKCVIFRSSDGNISPPVELLVIGEGPGYYESIEGKPFVGRSGKELDKMLDFIGLNYAITNVVKYRPTDSTGKDRKPTQDEVIGWTPILEKQIQLYKPKRILVLGDTALKCLFPDIKTTITNAANEHVILYYNKIPTFVYFHPSYLIRNNYDWEKDIKAIKNNMLKMV